MAACLKPVPITVPIKEGEVQVGVQDIQVRCGKCVPCLVHRRHEWFLRLSKEMQVSSSAYFVTLTYSDDHLYYNQNGVPSVCKRDVQLFLKRLRKYGRFRYYIAAEYGTRFGRPHYHALLFNLSRTQVDKISTVWGKGHVKIGSVTSRSINYTAGYIMMINHVPKGADRLFQVMSRRPGIGGKWLEVNGNLIKEANVPYIVVEGQRYFMPRYFRLKLFSSLRRQAFALDWIDKEYDQYIERLNRIAVMNPDCDPVELLKQYEKEYYDSVWRKRQKNLKLH